MPNRRWSKKEDEFLIDNINKSRSKDIALQLNRTHQAINLRVFTLKIKRINKLMRRYDVDDSFFSNVNIINSYLAGFIAADGYLMKDDKTLRFKIQTRDKQLLVKIKKLLKFDGPIFDRVYQENLSIGIDKLRYSSWLTITSGQIIRGLNHNFNIYLESKKNLCLRPPDLKNEECILAYIVGYIDGDGCIRINKRKDLVLNILGSKELITWISISLHKYYGIGKEILCNKRKRIFYYEVQSRKAFAILNKLLSICDKYNFGLKRKWNKVRNYIKEHEPLTS